MPIFVINDEEEVVENVLVWGCDDSVVNAMDCVACVVEPIEDGDSIGWIKIVSLLCWYYLFFFFGSFCARCLQTMTTCLLAILLSTIHK